MSYTATAVKKRRRESSTTRWLALVLCLITQLTPNSVNGWTRTFSLTPKVRSTLLCRFTPLRLHESQRSALSDMSSSAPDMDQPEVRWEDVLSPMGADDVEETIASARDVISSADKRALVLATGLGAIAFVWLVMASGPGAWRYYLSGGICAAASHTVPVPIDVIKTRKQVDPTLDAMHFVEATRHIVKEEGVRSLLAGLGPTTFGYLLEGGIKFGVYEVLKPFVGKKLTSLSMATSLSFFNTQLVAFIICGTFSGLAASVVLSPMEALRIRMVAEPNFAPDGWIQGGLRMLKIDGIMALTKGLKPMIYKQVPYTVVKNVSFDFSAKHAYEALILRGIHLSPAIKFTVPLLAAAVASVLACVFSQPGDMLLSLVNAHGGNRRTRDIVKDILRSPRGVRGFFVGMKTRLLHVGLIVTLQLLLYDIIKRLCGIPATGLV